MNVLAGAHARPRARRGLRTTSVAFALVVLLYILAWAMPTAYNWDMLAYGAIALDENDPEVRHSRLWAYVDRDVPVVAVAMLRGQYPEDLSDPRLIDTLEYRRASARDPQAFAEQLPFYAVKPMYPAAIAAGTRIIDEVSGWFRRPSDIGPIVVSVLIAKFCWMGLGVAFFLLMRLRFSNALAALATTAAMALPMVHGLGSYSTPDALSGLFILTAFVLALRDPSRPWTIAAAGVALLAVAARPDNLILLGLLLTWFLWNSRIRFRWAVVVGGVGVLWYLSIAQLSDNYGWSVLMHHSFYDYEEYPSQLDVRFTFLELMQLYWSMLPTSQVFFKYLGFGLGIAALRFYQRGSGDRLLQALLVMLGFMLAHWLIFPDQKDRLLVAAYLFILAAAAFSLADFAVRYSNFRPRLNSRTGLLRSKIRTNIT